MKKWYCRLRLHWLFDHAIAYNALFDCWRCKHCGLDIPFWPKPKRSTDKRRAIGGNVARMAVDQERERLQNALQEKKST